VPCAIASTIHLGQLPREFKDRVEFVGNTSKSGARAFLLNRRLRDELKQLVQRVHVLELANDPAFEKTFVKALSFSPSHENKKYMFRVRGLELLPQRQNVSVLLPD